MRTCPNCGHMLSEKDTICFKCGMQLSQISQPAPGNMPPQMNNNFNPMNNKGYNMQRPMNNNNDKSKMIYLVLGCVVVLAVIAVVIVLVTKNNKMDDEKVNYYLKVLNRCANRDSVEQFFNGVPGKDEQYYLGRDG